MKMKQLKNGTFYTYESGNAVHKADTRSVTSNGEWVELTFDRGLGKNFFFDLRKAAADKLVMYLDIEVYCRRVCSD